MYVNQNLYTYTCKAPPFFPSILFADAGEAKTLRTMLLPLFDQSAVEDYRTALSETMHHWIGDLAANAK